MTVDFRKRLRRLGAATAGPAGAQGMVVTAAAGVVAKARRAVAPGRGNAAKHREGPEARLHRVRVAIKRLRSYWRLAMPHLPPQVAAAERDRLRRLARSLAAHRDADVAAAVVTGLLGKTRDLRTRAVLRAWAEGRRAAAGSSAARERTLRSAIRALLTVPVRLAASAPVPAGWEWLEPGLVRSYRRGRRCVQACRRGGGDEAFHEWRRRIKDLQYFTELLRFLAPHRMGQRLRRIERVADALGDAHDLVILRDGLAGLPSASGSRRPPRRGGALSSPLRRRLEHRIAMLYREALRAARPLYLHAPHPWLRTQRAAWERSERRRGIPRPAPRRKDGKTDLIHGAQPSRMPE